MKPESERRNWRLTRRLKFNLIRKRLKERRRSRLWALVTILLLLAASFHLASTLKPSRAARQESRPNDREREARESPPEDWFITQRVTHGGIPAGALEKAGAQAAALASPPSIPNSQLADGAMEVRRADQYRRPRRGHRCGSSRRRHALRRCGHRRRVEEHRPGRAVYFDLAGDEPAVDGGAAHYSGRDTFCGDRRSQPRRRKHHLRRRGHLPVARPRQDLAARRADELGRHRPPRGGPCQSAAHLRRRGRTALQPRRRARRL